MSWLYTPIYWALVILCFSQTCYPIFMILTMFTRQSRLLYSLFHKSDPFSKKHGGELVAKVIKSHGIDNIFYLAGGHVSPIVVASDKLDINIVDVRHEATAVFAADASARLTGIPGVAVVTAGPGLTNTVTAIKNAQMAESPVVVIAGAAATMLKGRGSLQDIDQVSLLKTATKKCYSIDCVRDIIPTLREAFRYSQVGVPGPVFVELPVDILYPYKIIAEQFNTMSSKGSQKKPSIKSRIIEAYSNYRLNHIFADAWKDQDLEPLPVSVGQPDRADMTRVVKLLEQAKRPLVIVGAQSVLKPYGAEFVADCIRRLGIPVYVNGSARGLFGTDYPLQYRHARKDAVREADVVLLLGTVCDFRLSYGRIFKRPTKVVSVNRSMSSAKLNAGIFWQPEIAIESDVGEFLNKLVQSLGGVTKKHDLDDSVSSVGSSPALVDFDKTWLKELDEREEKKDAEIKAMSEVPTNKYMNPLKLLLEVKDKFSKDDTILVADGGDFVASASYILKPNGPLRWLDPGPFGTLGCGAGFALAAKLLNSDKKVLAIMGDGAFGYAISELDTFVRHNLPVYWLIGNDACWTQIEREQVPMLGSSIGCNLAYTDYHKVAEGFGAKGYKIEDESEMKSKNIIELSKKDNERNTVVVNALIGKTKFRDGSISV